MARKRFIKPLAMHGCQRNSANDLAREELNSFGSCQGLLDHSYEFQSKANRVNDGNVRGGRMLQAESILSLIGGDVSLSCGYTVIPEGQMAETQAQILAYNDRIVMLAKKTESID